MVLRSVEPLGLDQGLFALFGQELPRGAVPYRDLWDSKPPLILLIYPLAMLLFGKSVAAVWLFESAWLGGTLLAAFFVGRRLWDRATGLVAAALLLLGLWAPGWELLTSRAQAEEFLVLPALLALCLALDPEHRQRSALLAGISFGCVTLFKVPAAVAGVALALALWEDDRRRFLRNVLVLLVGVAIPWTLICAWLALAGALGAMWQAAFVYSGVYARTVGEGLSWLSIAGDMLNRLALALPLMLLAALIAIVGGAVRRDRASVIVASWFVGTLIAVVAQQQLAPYHFLLCVPPLALLAARGVTLVSALVARRRATLLLAIAVGGALSAPRIIVWWRAYRLDAARIAGTIDLATYLRALGGGPTGPSAQANMARYVTTHTDAGDAVLLWALQPGVYFLADRKPATRFPFHHLLLTEVPLSTRWDGLSARREQFLARLRAKPPKLIVVAEKDDSYFMPDDSRTQMIRFAEFHQFVREQYGEPERIGSYWVYRHR